MSRAASGGPAGGVAAARQGEERPRRGGRERQGHGGCVGGRNYDRVGQLVGFRAAQLVVELVQFDFHGMGRLARLAQTFAGRTQVPGAH
jgi:hypothetical protein